MGTQIKSALGLAAVVILVCTAWLAFGLLAQVAGVFLLAFLCSLALAGPGNRVIGCAVFALLAMAMFAVLAWGATHLPKDGGLVGGVLLYGLLPLWPAVFLWAAHRLRRSLGLRRSKAGDAR